MVFHSIFGDVQINLRPGDITTYYPRAGKPGHRVTIVSLIPHILHIARVRFRYQDGREREVTWGRFHQTAVSGLPTSPPPPPDDP